MTETTAPVIVPSFCFNAKLTEAIRRVAAAIRARRVLLLAVLLLVAVAVGGTVYRGGTLAQTGISLGNFRAYVWRADDDSGSAWDGSPTAGEQRDNQTRDQIATLPSRGGDVTRVLLVSYMRGGSSVLGEAFNQNHEAFHWFEPLDGVYSHLYGTMHGWMPLDILFHNNGSIRNIPDFEREAVVTHLRQIFDCDIEQLPLDVLTNYNLITIIQNGVYRYAECIRLGTQDPKEGAFRQYMRTHAQWTRSLSRKASFTCKRPLFGYCPQHFDYTRLMELCHRDLHGVLDPTVPSGSIPDYIKPAVNATYHRCMEQAAESCQPCFHILKEECQSAKVRAAKVIRLNPELIEDLLGTIPGLKIVMYFRDPRAIVWSRQLTHLLSRVSSKKAIKEGDLVCKRLRHDLRIMQQMQDKYQGSLLQLKYEDLIGDPTKTVQQMYEFLGAPMSKETTDKFERILHDSTDSGYFGTSRRNATATATRWMRGIPAGDRVGITTVCADVLEQLGYTP